MCSVATLAPNGSSVRAGARPRSPHIIGAQHQGLAQNKVPWKPWLNGKESRTLQLPTHGRQRSEGVPSTGSRVALSAIRVGEILQEALGASLACSRCSKKCRRLTVISIFTDASYTQRRVPPCLLLMPFPQPRMPFPFLDTGQNFRQPWGPLHISPATLQSSRI